MKNQLTLLLLLLTFPAFGAGVQWNNYPTTNGMGNTDTLLTGNGATNLTITAANFGTSRTVPLINTSSNLIYGNANTAIDTSSNLSFAIERTAINTSSNSLFGTLNTAINTSSNSVVTNLPPRANYPALTNTTTGIIGNVLMTTAHLDTNGSPAAIWTNLQPFNLEFHIATNAFTNVVVGYIGPLTNIDGFKFYIPVGTNFP